MKGRQDGKKADTQIEEFLFSWRGNSLVPARKDERKKNED